MNEILLRTEDIFVNKTCQQKILIVVRERERKREREKASKYSFKRVLHDDDGDDDVVGNSVSYDCGYI